MTTYGKAKGFLEVSPADPEQRDPSREVVLLLHGLGGNKLDWSFPAWREMHWNHRQSPANRHSDNHFGPPLLAPLAALGFLTDFSLSDLDTNVRCWEGMLRAKGHTVINYSQDGNQALVEIPLVQFEQEIVPTIRDEVLTGSLAGKKVTLVCHSRGGILARRYVHDHPTVAPTWIKHIVTLCTPNQGTLAPLAKEKLTQQALAGLVGPIADAIGVDDLLVNTIDRLTDWLSETEGAEQLLPDNALFERLANPADAPDIEFTTFAGNSVRYSRLYYWLYTLSSFIPNFSDFPDIRFDYEQFPTELPLISPLLDQIPDGLVDDEQDDNEGDGAVSDLRARLPGAPHTTVPVNHAEALWDETLFGLVADLLGTPLTGNENFECSRGFIGNSNTLQVHDPMNENTNCQLDEIDSIVPFKRIEDALTNGYDGCFYCLSEHHTPEQPTNSPMD